jgi:hypothetical protein
MTGTASTEPPFKLRPPSFKREDIMTKPAKPLSKEEIAARIRAAGKRAKAEADERRAQAARPPLPKEVGGPEGPEPTRYGDWERKGIISDF